MLEEAVFKRDDMIRGAVEAYRKCEADTEDLGPAQIARAVGLSTRYVHTLCPTSRTAAARRGQLDLLVALLERDRVVYPHPDAPAAQDRAGDWSDDA